MLNCQRVSNTGWPKWSEGTIHPPIESSWWRFQWSSNAPGLSRHVCASVESHWHEFVCCFKCSRRIKSTNYSTVTAAGWCQFCCPVSHRHIFVTWFWNLLTSCRPFSTHLRIIVPGFPTCFSMGFSPKKSAVVSSPAAAQSGGRAPHPIWSSWTWTWRCPWSSGDTCASCRRWRWPWCLEIETPGGRFFGTARKERMIL